MQATSEEVVYRGFMFPPDALKLPVIAAFVGPTVIFTFLHGAGEGAGPIPFINVAIFAVAAVLVYLADRGLIVAIGIHIGWNWFQGNVFGISVSGLDLNENSIFRLAEVEGESRLISGGRFGIEATIATTILWLVLTAVAAGVLWRRSARLAHQ